MNVPYDNRDLHSFRRWAFSIFSEIMFSVGCLAVTGSFTRQEVVKQLVFISSVQKELATERRALKDYIQGDALLSRFFEVFLFEDMPASGRRADKVYLKEVDRCDIYLGLFGNDYGYEDADGVSPTEREFDAATAANKERLIFIKGDKDTARHPKMRAFVRKAGTQLVRRRFTETADLIDAVYASLVDYLERTGTIQNRPFDKQPCPDATLDDINQEALTNFIRRARTERQFPLEVDTPMIDVLSHLDMISDGKPTRAAILLFGHKPQRFHISAVIKCARFHGTQVAKPIPFYQIFEGTLYQQVDNATDFVLSKLDRSVGTRSVSAAAPVKYEIPKDAIMEIIVNAVAHRDYTSNSAVQVFVFSDRVEVWNPGHLPRSLTPDKLRKPHSSDPPNHPYYDGLRDFQSGYINFDQYLQRSQGFGSDTRYLMASWETTQRQVAAEFEATQRMNTFPTLLQTYWYAARNPMLTLGTVISGDNATWDAYFYSAATNASYGWGNPFANYQANMDSGVKMVQSGGDRLGTYIEDMSLRSGYQVIAGVGGFFGELTRTGTGMIGGTGNFIAHPVQTYDNMVDSTAQVMARNYTMGEYDTSRWSWETFGAVRDGVANITGSLVGFKPLMEGIYGIDINQARDLSTMESAQRILAGGSQMLLTGTGLASYYTSAANQLGLQTFNLKSFELGGYGVIRSKAIVGVATRAEIGMAGEYLGGMRLANQGFTELTAIKNASGHGIDWTGIAPNGQRMFFEVKASAGPTAYGPYGVQANINDFVTSRINMAAGGNGAWSTVNPTTKALAGQIRLQLNSGLRNYLKSLLSGYNSNNPNWL